MANHVLYHVAPVDRAVEECHRVLRAGGRLLAATNSQTSMTELTVLICEGYDRLGIPLTAVPDRASWPFTLENGQAILTPWFDQVERHVLHSALVFAEPAPLLAYIDSMRGLYEPNLPDGVSWDNLLQVLHEMVADYIARHGEFRVNKASGAFVAIKYHPA
jgi:SAM-dependent methyltransferase